MPIFTCQSSFLNSDLCVGELPTAHKIQAKRKIPLGYVDAILSIVLTFMTCGNRKSDTYILSNQGRGVKSVCVDKCYR